MLDQSAAPPATGRPTAPAGEAGSRSLGRAGRYAVLRRLAPALRHDMVVHLQSLGMMAEALGARLERGVVAPDDVQGAVSKLNRLSRQAVAAAVEVSTWMQPSEDDTLPLREGVEECTSLLASSLNFRGYTVRNEAGASDMDVPRNALRFLLCAALLTLADAADAPGDVVVRTETTESHAVILVEYQAHPERDVLSGAQAAHEPLAWPEIQAIAAEEDAEIARRGDSIVLRLPRAVVTSPLKMAPV